MSQDIETMFENNLQESGNVVTKGAKPAERSELKNDAEEIGGPTPTSGKPDDTESIGKKVAAKVKKAAAPSTKPSGASGDKQDSLKKSPTFEETQEDGEVIEEETEETIQYSFDEDLDALVSGSDLTEEFRDKAKLIFEAAVNAKINEEVANLNEAYEAAFEEAVTEFKTEMSEQIDSYLTFVAEKWVAENALAIDSGIKTEIAENIMLGLKNLFQENHLDVPEEEFDVVAEMTEQLDVMESKLNEQIDLNVEMHKKLGNYIKNGIVSEVSVGLAETQKDKLQGLSEGVEFINESDFREKIETLKESYFTRAAAPAVEDAPVEQPVSGDAMSLYSQAISRWSTRQA
jgi:ribosomal protein S13